MDTPPQYIACPKYKGNPRKHLEVCRECHWRKGCKPYQRYLQPELPFAEARPAAAAEAIEINATESIVSAPKK